MKGQMMPLRRIRFVYRRSPALLKCVALAAVLLSTVAVAALRMSTAEVQAQTRELKLQALQLEQENSVLQQELSELGTIDGVRHIASRRLGLVDPNTTVFHCRPSSSIVKLEETNQTWS